MEKEILFISRKSDRGGAIYEDQVRKIIEKDNKVDILDLNPNKNKIFFFKTLQYAHQIKIYKPAKEHRLLITNRAGIYAGVLKRKFKKSVLVLHHFSSDENKYPVIRTVLERRFISSLKTFDCIVVVADFWKKYLQEYVSPDKIRVIYNSFDVEKINENISGLNRNLFKKNFDIPDNKIVVYAGNALKIKGYREVIDQLDPKRFFVITTGAKEGNVEHLHLKLDYKNYIRLLASVDITVILSKLVEGWNRIAHESLLVGTPVIGTKMGGLGELLHRAGQDIYCEGANLESLITKAISNQNAAVSGLAFASQYNSDYFSKSWKTIINEMNHDN